MPRSEDKALDLGSLADQCLAYLAEHPEELLGFMQAAGYDPQSLQGAVGSPQLQRGLVDYFASNEAILLAFCANAGIAPETFMRAWHKMNPVG